MALRAALVVAALFHAVSGQGILLLDFFNFTERLITDVDLPFNSSIIETVYTGYESIFAAGPSMAFSTMLLVASLSLSVLQQLVFAH